MRDAFRQHASRQCARHGARLGRSEPTPFFSASPRSPITSAGWRPANGCSRVARLVMNSPPAGASMRSRLAVQRVKATYVMGVPTHSDGHCSSSRKSRGMNRFGRRENLLHGGRRHSAHRRGGFLRARHQGAERLRHDGRIRRINIRIPNDLPRDNGTTPAAVADLRMKCGCSIPRIKTYKPVKAGEIGHICGKDAVAAHGCWAISPTKPATEGSFNKDGWFLSGDLGEIADAAIMATYRSLWAAEGHREARRPQHPSRPYRGPGAAPRAGFRASPVLSRASTSARWAKRVGIAVHRSAIDPQMRC